MLSYKTRREREVGKARRRELVIGRAFASHVSSVRYHGGRGSKRQTRSVDWTYEIARQSSGLRRFVRFTWSLEKTHLTLIQRCALTVQLHPSIAHIPGGALSTLPTRNTKQHRDTDHTIARSRFGPFGHTLHTLLPPLMLSAIHHHHPRSSSGEQKAALFHPDRSPSILHAEIFPHIVHGTPLYPCPTFIWISIFLDRPLAFLSLPPRVAHICLQIPVSPDPASRIFGSDKGRIGSSSFKSVQIRIFPQRRPGSGRVPNGMPEQTDAETRKCGTENWSSGCIHRGIYSVERRARTARLSEEVGQLEAG